MKLIPLLDALLAKWLAVVLKYVKNFGPATIEKKLGSKGRYSLFSENLP